MSNDETKKCEDCDDPCDDCSDTKVLTGWTKPQPKPVDKDDKS